MHIHDQEYLQGSRQSDAAVVVSLDALDSTLLPIAGGKAANLGELIRAGFSVPPGFCVTTAAYIQVSAELAPLLADLNALQSGETARRAALAAAARRVLEEAPVPPAVTEAITAAYLMLKNEGNGGPVPVAVRSSATAEDLPYASFAGQQETYLNVVGIEAVLSAVRHCWASLWTERAVSYRASLGFDHRAVNLAVIVQRMIDARVAGVLFTANPLTGKRHQAVIDASPGLGEAIVSGVVNPDHDVVSAVRRCAIKR
jgi:phosphoenolpyruvate synthase/pyruvate phosphate dikinase